MDLRQLEAFVAVATLGSFKAAANRLTLTQPAISARISSLEAEIGESLFVRDVRPARLTDRAKRILAHAQEILEISQKINPAGNVRELKAPERLRFGLNSSLVSGWLPNLTDRLIPSLKNVSMEFDVDITQHLIDKMRSGMLDICLMHSTSEIPGIKRHFVCEVETIWAAKAGIFEQKRISTEEIAKHKIFTFGPDAPTRTEFDAHLRSKELYPLTYHMTNHCDVIISHMRWSEAVGLLTAGSIHRELANGEFERIDAEFNAPDYSLWICYPLTKRGSTINLCIEQLMLVAQDMDLSRKRRPNIDA